MWIIFFFGTFMVQLIFMNLLIAIMSDSFATLNEDKEPSTLKSFCELMDEFEFIINYKKEFKDARYILYMGAEEHFVQKTPVESHLDKFDMDAKTRMNIGSIKIANHIARIQDKSKMSFNKQHEITSDMLNLVKAKKDQKKEESEKNEKRMTGLEKALGKILKKLGEDKDNSIEVHDEEEENKDSDE
jgi:hypothetical protein